MRLDVVIPIYNEQAVLPALLERLRSVLGSVEGIEWRVIFVNDGSDDDSARIILMARDDEPAFALLELSRNFGHQAAISAGLAHADADAVVVMDGDLQDPPEVIPDLIRAWREGGEVVLPVRNSRQETGVRRLGFETFHRVFSWISDFEIEGRTGVFGLLDRKAVIAFNELSERNRFIPGLRAWIGFEQRRVDYDRRERVAGRPKQKLTSLLRYAADGIIGFSLKPLRLMTLSGLVVSAIGFFLALVFIIKRLTGVEVAETGFTTLVTLILFLGGIQLMGIGLLGEYLGRTYDEVRSRPLYLVSRRHGLEPWVQSEKPTQAILHRD